MTTKIPAIPSLDGITDKKLFSLISAMKEIIEIREGRRGNAATDRFVTLGEFDTLFASEYETTAEDLYAYTIYSHAASHSILYAELNAFHLVTAAATITLPEILSDYIGYWVDIRKRTTADVIISCAGSDVIVEAGTTGLSNTHSGENWSSIRLVMESVGVWGIDKQLGTWQP